MNSVHLDTLSYEEARNYFRSVVFGPEQLGQDKARFQVVKVPAGQTVARHYHRERTEVFVILQGSGQIYINDELAASQLHDMVLCRPNDRHEVVNSGETDLLIGVFALNYDTNDSFEDKENKV